MPAVMFTGYSDWQYRMGGRLTQLFKIKITCGLIVMFLSLFLVIWYLLDPGIPTSNSTLKLVYIFLHIAIVAAGGVAGYYGGKLIKFPGD
jgi:hypothetical protein